MRTIWTWIKDFLRLFWPDPEAADKAHEEEFQNAKP